MVLTVTELANKSGTTPHAVRYYSRMGLLRPERHPENGYRLYKQSEVNWLRFIRQAKSLGFSLSEIKKIMHDSDSGQSPCPRVREILQHRIEDNRIKLNEMEALQSRMENALDSWGEMPDGVPDGDSVCYLIESFTEGDMPCH